MTLTPPSSIAPATVAIAGPVTISGTVPVSVATLPLPAGAATEASLARVNGAIQDVALSAILERDKLSA